MLSAGLLAFVSSSVPCQLIISQVGEVEPFVHPGGDDSLGFGSSRFCGAVLASRDDVRDGVSFLSHTVRAGDTFILLGVGESRGPWLVACGSW